MSMASETAGVRRHVLASSNLLLGASNFVVLALPERYSIGQTINPAEVGGTHQARGAAWVLDGRCSHFIRDSGGPSLEILVVSDRGERTPRWGRGDGLTATLVAEHEAHVGIDRIRVGFPRRRTMERLRAWWPCERTKRTLQIEIVGPEGVDLVAVAAVLPHSECH